jgi:uncharacterized short protein YbdD (DUF466 family)
MLKAMKTVWQAIRQLSGDDAYERYLRHHAKHHLADGEPLSKQEFFKKWQDDKWRGVKRCC